MDERGMFRLMYVGACTALNIPNLDAAGMLADATNTAEEVAHAIGVMRRSPEGDRVWPALAALRELHKAADAKVAP